MVIILGNKYTFNEKEKKKLKSKYKNIVYLSYRDRADTVEILDRYIKNSSRCTVVLNTKAKLPSSLVKYLVTLEHVGVVYIKIEDFLEKIFSKCYIDLDSSDTSYFIQIKSLSKFQLFQKSIFDLIMIVVSSPMFLITYLVSVFPIKIQSPGEILYKQERISKDNKPFICTKIRTMHIEAEKDGPCFAEENDSRTYPWGKFLRDSKLDELGQIINILKGNMHFVGPRPERYVWINEFEKTIPYYNLRHLVKPGITGLAQIEYQYGRGLLDAKEKLMYDLYYIKHWNIWLDIKIVFKTAIFIVKKFI